MKIKSARISVIAVFLAAVLILYTAALYNLQIIKGADYYYESLNSIVTTNTVKASRGEVFDRYGNVLISNRTIYNLTINHSILTNSDNPNATLLKLKKVCEDHGIAFSDTLPISSDSPYAYVSFQTDIQKTQFDKYLKYFEFKQTPSAEDFMAYLVKHYKIAGSYSKAEARTIAGLRYELELRLIFPMSEFIIARDVKIDLISVILEQNLVGVQIDSSTVREYHTPYAAHLLGTVGQMDEAEYAKYSKLGYMMDDVIGKDGIEAEFESYLRGTNGTKTSTVNSSGAVTNVIYNKKPEPGKNVVLTLDIGLQGAAENILAKRIAALNSARGEKEEKIPGGAVVAIQVATGDILACASNPTYDLSKFYEQYGSLVKDPALPLFNRALQGTYSPGSTFKMVTGVAALQEGVITPSTRIYDEGKYTKYLDYQPNCWIYPDTHGWENIAEAVRDSCNFFFFSIGDRLGIDRIASYASQFGLGRETGVELYEELGTLATPEYKEEAVGEEWYGGDTLQASIGQSFNLFTPLQIASYTATIANNGIRYKTHFLKSVVKYDFSSTYLTEDREILSTVKAGKEAFDAIHQGMLLVTTQGTPAAVFKDFGIKVAAKTGTAQLGEDLQNNAIFICYAPYENPEIAVAVVIEKGGSGNAIASIAKEVLQYYFNEKAEREKTTGENRLVN